MQHPENIYFLYAYACMERPFMCGNGIHIYIYTYVVTHVSNEDGCLAQGTPRG